MAKVILGCQFCNTLNRVEMEQAGRKPICSKCKKPFLLDRPVKVTEEHFDKTVLEAEIPVLVDFYADWCGPCKMMAPILDEIASEKAGDLLVAKVDTDRSPKISERYGIKGIPFFARFENGQLVKSATGAVGREGLQDLVA